MVGMKACARDQYWWCLLRGVAPRMNGCSHIAQIRVHCVAEFVGDSDGARKPPPYVGLSGLFLVACMAVAGAVPVVATVWCGVCVS